MDINELLAKCPPYTCVRFYKKVAADGVFVHASPGDAVELVEVNGTLETGRRITALILDCEAGSLSTLRRVSSEDETQATEKRAMTVMADLDVRLALERVNGDDALFCWLIVADQSVGPLVLGEDEAAKVSASTARVLEALGVSTSPTALHPVLDLRVVMPGDDGAALVTARGMGCNAADRHLAEPRLTCSLRRSRR